MFTFSAKTINVLNITMRGNKIILSIQQVGLILFATLFPEYVGIVLSFSIGSNMVKKYMRSLGKKVTRLFTMLMEEQTKILGKNIRKRWRQEAKS